MRFIYRFDRPCESGGSALIPHRPVIVPRGIPSPSRLAPNDNGRADGHRLEIALVLRKPLEEQQQRVDLVVVAAAREVKELFLEIGEPRGFVR